MSVRRAALVERPLSGSRLGRHVEHDPASRLYPALMAKGKAKTVVHPRAIAPLDQGDLGSCTGNALVGCLATGPLTPVRGVAYDEELAVKIYSLATQLDGFAGEYPPDDTGSSGLGACRAAKKLGLLRGYRHAFGIEHAIAALQRQPVITGVPWYEGFDRPDADGKVEIGGQVRGGHEFEVAEFYPDPAGALDGLVGAWQSWGLGFGLGGRFFFTARTWGNLLEQEGDVTVPSRRAVSASVSA